MNDETNPYGAPLMFLSDTELNDVVRRREREVRNAQQALDRALAVQRARHTDRFADA